MESRVYIKSLNPPPPLCLQIRRMLDTQGYGVTALHRVEVMGLNLAGLREGEWKPCSDGDMSVIRKCLEDGAASAGVSRGKGEGGGSAVQEEESDDE